MRFDNQKEDDQRAEDHELDVGDQGRGNRRIEGQHAGVQQDRQQHDEGGAEEGAENRAQPADDDHEQHLEGAVDLEGQGFHRARIDEGPERAGDADVEGADGEGRELGPERPDADDLGGDIHVANGHPGAADAAAHQVLGNQRQDRDEAEQEVVLGDRLGLGAGDEGARQHLARRRGDHAGGAVVGPPVELVEHPDEEELRRQGRDREIEALDAQRGDAEQDADHGRAQAGQQKDQDDVQLGKGGGQLVGEEGAAGHEAAGAEAELPAIARQQVEPDRRHREDEEGDQDGVQHVGAGHQRDHDHGKRQDEDHPELVLQDGEDRLVGAVARLELSGFAVKHCATLSR